MDTTSTTRKTCTQEMVTQEATRVKRLISAEYRRHQAAIAALSAELRRLQEQCSHPETVIDRGEYDMPTWKVCLICGKTLE